MTEGVTLKEEADRLTRECTHEEGATTATDTRAIWPGETSSKVLVGKGLTGTS